MIQVSGVLRTMAKDFSVAVLVRTLFAAAAASALNAPLISGVNLRPLHPLVIAFRSEMKTKHSLGSV